MSEFSSIFLAFLIIAFNFSFSLSKLHVLFDFFIFFKCRFFDFHHFSLLTNSVVQLHVWQILSGVPVMDSMLDFDTKGPGSIPGVYISFLIHSFFCAKFCPKQISPAYQHQTFPVNVRKNYISSTYCAKFC